MIYIGWHIIRETAVNQYTGYLQECYRKLKQTVILRFEPTKT